MVDAADVYVVHQGFLTKRGKNVKNWKRRWFVLKSNGSLSYFKLQVAPEVHQELPRPAGTFFVDKGCSIIPREDVKANIDWGDAAPNTGLCIRTEGRDYYVSASTASERKIWLQRLRSVRDRSRRRIGAGNESSFRSTASDEHIQLSRERPFQRPTSYSDASHLLHQQRGSQSLARYSHMDEGEDDGDEQEAAAPFSQQQQQQQQQQGARDTSNTSAVSGIQFSADDDGDDDGDDAETSENHEYVNVQVAVDPSGLSHFALREDLPAEEAAKLQQQHQQQ